MHATPDKKSSKPQPTLQSLDGTLGHSQTTRPFSAQERRKSQNGFFLFAIIISLSHDRGVSLRIFYMGEDIILL